MQKIDIPKVLRELLTDSTIEDDPHSLKEVNTATFATTEKNGCIVRSKTVEDISILVRFAAKNKLTLSVMSCGKNWGFGSKVPVYETSILLDLSTMNRILSYDPSFGTVCVEPGVTFKQLTQFLAEHGNQHFLNTIGGSPDASVLANILERGDGVGPYCERFEYACAPEVMLADGTIQKFGFDNIKNSNLSELCDHGLGPDFRGLFIQSNLGIVTKITLWLCAIPHHFRIVNYFLETSEPLSKVLNELKTLYVKRILLFPLTFWNDYKQIVTTHQYPWSLTQGETPLSRELIKKNSNAYSAWQIFGGIYHDHSKIGKLVEKELTASIKKYTKNETFLSMMSTKKAYWIKKLNWISKKLGFDFSQVIDTWDHNPLLGFPTHGSVRSQYWRKKLPIPRIVEPNRDFCGVLWNAFVMPFEGVSIAAALAYIEKIILENGFEPVISFMVFNDRYVKIFQQLLYDRSIEGEDIKARRCHQQVFDYLEKFGFSHYRLDILTMPSFMQRNMKNLNLYHKIKNALDPDSIFMEGRYS